MTLEQIQALSAPDLNDKIARALGWRLEYPSQRPGAAMWVTQDGQRYPITPSWDLSYAEWHRDIKPALHNGWSLFSATLSEMVIKTESGTVYGLFSASPRQLCEAALFTLLDESTAMGSYR